MLHRLFFAFFAVVMLVASCASIPQAELSRFSTLYSETKVAGDAILDEVSAAAKPEDGQQASSNDCAIDPRTGFRPCFRVELALAGTQSRPHELPDIRVRRLALEVIATYTRILVDMAGGRSGKVIEARIADLGELSQAVTALAPGVGKVTGQIGFATIGSILSKLENARTSGIAAASLLEAEPDIRALIRLMINDTPALYRLYVGQYSGNLGRMKIAKRRAELKGDGAEAARLAVVIRNLQDPNGSANRARAFEAALTKYVQLLDQNDKALGALSRAISDPSLGPIDRATDFVKRATQMRMLLEGLQADLRTLRDAAR